MNKKTGNCNFCANKNSCSGICGDSFGYSNSEKYKKQLIGRKTIRFSHNYTKFRGRRVTEANLLEVLTVELKDLSAPFLEYDTAHKTGNYPLKNGRYLLLILEARGLIFTTLRPWNAKKEEYYRSGIGERFTIEISEEN